MSEQALAATAMFAALVAAFTTYWNIRGKARAEGMKAYAEAGHIQLGTTKGIIDLLTQQLAQLRTDFDRLQAENGVLRDEVDELRDKAARREAHLNMEIGKLRIRIRELETHMTAAGVEPPPE